MALIEWFRSLIARNAPKPPEPPAPTWEPPQAPPKLPRGLRNRNPGNLRGGETKWQGEVGRDKDGFCIFATDELGLRACARLLVNYHRKYELNTVSEIIHRWAPPSENNTVAYVAAVAADMVVGPQVPLNMEDPAVICNLVRAIVKHENGKQPYTPSQIATGVRMAFEGL
jgi:hypothetical protein